MSITIVHTNDTHGNFRPPVTDRLRTLREAHPDSFLLDAGDTVSAGNLGFRPNGEPALEELSALRCDAMCLGNRETHPRKEVFPLKLSRAAFPVLCANLRAKGEAPLLVHPYVLLERDGVKLGIFGVTVSMFGRKQWSQPLCDYWFEDPLQTARAQVNELRPHVDLLIALTHIGFRQDQALATLCPELDLIIGGHSHTDLTAPHVEGGVPILQARSHGFYAGVAVLEPGQGLLSWEKHPLRDDIPPPK